jgi:hypothetical protein
MFLRAETSAESGRTHQATQKQSDTRHVSQVIDYRSRQASNRSVTTRIVYGCRSSDAALSNALGGGEFCVYVQKSVVNDDCVATSFYG